MLIRPQTKDEEYDDVQAEVKCRDCGHTLTKPVTNQSVEEYAKNGYSSSLSCEKISEQKST